MYSPALTDFVVMVKGTSHMFITGPDVVKTVTGEDVTQEELGGAMTHASKSGVAAFVYDDEQTALAQVRYLLSFLPPNNLEDPPYFESDDDPDRSCDGIVDLIPDAPNKPYDMKKVIAEVVDDGDFFEVNALWAMNIVCGFARVDGHVVGIVGQPAAGARGHARHRRVGEGGALRAHVRRVQRPARHLRRRARASCPGTDQEYGGIIRHGAKLLYAYCEATVPRVQIITRKAYGGAYVVMNSKSIGADLAFAWPSAEVAVMGAPGAVNLIFRKEIETADDPEAQARRADRGVHRALRQPVHRGRARLRRRRDRPARDARVLVRSLAMLRTKREQLPSRKHGNVPAVRRAGPPAVDLAGRDPGGGRGDRRRDRRRSPRRYRGRATKPTTPCTSGCARRGSRSRRAGLQRGPWRLSGASAAAARAVTDGASPTPSS